jgi:peptide/nickel transport system substrate-binding protein
MRTHPVSKTGLLVLCLVFSLIFGLLSSCKTEQNNTSEEDFSLKVRLAFEPDRLNPMLSSLTQATQIERKIFLPLADYNPITLQLEPILLTALPEISEISEGIYAGGAMYQMFILPEATWDDGTPITGHDYIFTMKAALDPYLNNLAWQSHMDHMVEIEVDSTDPKKITVITNVEYILSESVITTNPLYPAHIYDEKNLLKPYSFGTIKNHHPEQDSALDKVLHNFAEQFNSEPYSRNIVSGGGPYEFVEWIPNQQIVVKRKEKWWGHSLNVRHPILQAFPSIITYYFIPDAQTAITALKNNKIDVLAELSPEQYHELDGYNEQSNSLTLKTAPILQYYFVAYNNDHKILQDSRVRNAISRLMDIQSLVDKLFFGLAAPTTGPILPATPAYDHSLKPIAFQPEEARRLLKEAGWQDSNNNQILDKEIDGELIEMQFTILTTRSQLSQDVAILLKEQATRVGISMEIIPLDTRNLIQNIKKGDYELACLASIQEIGPYDPYNSWHSNNASLNGNNWCKFRNPEADAIIDEIKHTLDPAARDKLYRSFQRIIYQEQPALFLVSPKFCMAVNQQIIFEPTAMRPGYFENTFKLK